MNSLDVIGVKKNELPLCGDKKPVKKLFLAGLINVLPNTIPVSTMPDEKDNLKKHEIRCLKQVNYKMKLSEIEVSLKVAMDINNYVQSLGMLIENNMPQNFKGVPLSKQGPNWYDTRTGYPVMSLPRYKTWGLMINNLRDKVKDARTAVFDPASSDEQRLEAFEKIRDVILHYGIARCEELAWLGYLQARKTLRESGQPTVNLAEIVNGDHVFLLVRKGMNVWVLDPWANDIYPKELAELRMKDFCGVDEDTLNPILQPIDPNYQSIGLLL